MSRNKKPRKAYRPRPVTCFTMEVARDRAAKPAADERKEVLDALRKSFTALREGVGTEDDWSVLAGSLALALTIELQGVVRGLGEHLRTADTALESILNRAKATDAWKRTPLYFHEIDALRVFVNLHAYQVEQLGRAEWLRAIDTTDHKIRSQGFGVTMVRDLERLAA